MSKKIVIKKPHYYVPPCPECGSYCTGRYIRHPVVESWYVEEKSLKNAEIVRFVAKEPVLNCFCVDCGHEWGKTITLTFITEEEMEEERERRGTKEAFEEIHELNRDMLKKKQKNPIRRITRWIFG